ncbi:hypothetical protein [Desulfovibrio sp. TomC]|uniref:hypothetical protein n=1 Tax=Desulfovibrio sp. TomC TaxID=1562888 RepID=UPI000573BE39|nr:hypothetical protein [Desulfovibrio sp. TomC]KHK02328.1 hypothetical protein NY78_2086 [Desulfovibrio sp. TomC]
MDGNDSRRIDRLEAVLRAAHARRPAPLPEAGLAGSVLAAIKATPAVAATPADASQRIDRLEAVLQRAQANRPAPPLDPGLAASVLATLRAESAEADGAVVQENRVLWRMAAGAGLLAVATVLVALTFGSGLEEELGRLLFYDPSGQVLVSLLGV